MPIAKLYRCRRWRPWTFEQFRYSRRLLQLRKRRQRLRRQPVNAAVPMNVCPNDRLLGFGTTVNTTAGAAALQRCCRRSTISWFRSGGGHFQNAVAATVVPKVSAV